MIPCMARLSLSCHITSGHGQLQGWAVRVQAGLGAGISARCIWHVREGTTARVAARASLTGMQLEVGALQKVGDFSTAGCSVVVNLQVSICLYICLGEGERQRLLR